VFNFLSFFLLYAIIEHFNRKVKEAGEGFINRSFFKNVNQDEALGLYLP